MKTASVILPACLLALVHHISAQTEAPINCEQVRNLTSQCRRAFEFQNSNEATAFCSGNCFTPVLRAHETCESDQRAAAVAQQIRDGEKLSIAY